MSRSRICPSSTSIWPTRHCPRTASNWYVTFRSIFAKDLAARKMKTSWSTTFATSIRAWPPCVNVKKVCRVLPNTNGRFSRATARSVDRHAKMCATISGKHISDNVLNASRHAKTKLVAAATSLSSMAHRIWSRRLEKHLHTISWISRIHKVQARTLQQAYPWSWYGPWPHVCGSQPESKRSL